MIDFDAIGGHVAGRMVLGTRTDRAKGAGGQYSKEDFEDARQDAALAAWRAVQDFKPRHGARTEEEAEGEARRYAYVAAFNATRAFCKELNLAKRQCAPAEAEVLDRAPAQPVVGWGRRDSLVVEAALDDLREVVEDPDVLAVATEVLDARSDSRKRAEAFGESGTTLRVAYRRLPWAVATTLGLPPGRVRAILVELEEFFLARAPHYAAART